MIIVSARVKKGLDAAAKDGVLTPAPARSDVIAWLGENKYTEAAKWVLGNPRLFGRGLMEGFGTRADEKKETAPDVVALSESPIAVLTPADDQPEGGEDD